MKTQSQMILAYLRKGKRLTVLSALEKFGVYALSQRCTEMQRSGIPIKREMITLKNGKRVAEYSI